MPSVNQRCTPCVWSLLICLCFVLPTGCRWLPNNARQTASADTAPDASNAPRGPFRSYNRQQGIEPDSEAVAASSKSAGETAAVPAPDNEAGETAAVPAPDNERETVDALLARELADATPADRATWERSARTLDRAQLEMALRTRRLAMSIQPESGRIGHAAPPGATAAAARRRPASGSPVDPFQGRARTAATDTGPQSVVARRPLPSELTQEANNLSPAAVAASLENPTAPGLAGHAHPADDLTQIFPTRNPDRLTAASGASGNAAETRTANVAAGVSAQSNSAPIQVTGGTQAAGNARSLTLRLANDPKSPAWTEDLIKLIDLVESEVAELKPDPARPEVYEQRQVALRMLYLIAGEQQRALSAIPQVNEAQREFWQQMFWALSQYFDTEYLPNSTDRATETVAQLRAAIRQLSARARLEIRDANFCQRISSFGVYERFSEASFRPSQPVLIYAEIENFSSEELVAQGQYRTVLRSTIEVYERGDEQRSGRRLPIDRVEFAPTEDLCSRPRRDYFHSYEYAIPQDISPGPHTLVLTVEDQLGESIATTALNFTVVR